MGLRDSDMKRRFSLYLLVALLVGQFFTLPTTVSAQFDPDFYSNNDITFFNPTANPCGPRLSVGESSIDIKKSETLDTIFDFLTSESLSSNGNRPLSDEQAAGIMGNMYAESRFDTSAIEVTDREDKGHGLVQWTFGRWDNLQAYAEAQDGSWDDLDIQLGFLKQELEGSESGIFDDAQFTSSEEPAITAMRFRIIFERADPTVAHDSVREAAAIAVYNLYSDGSASGCVTGSGIIAGDLVRTAVNFALPAPAQEGTNSRDDAVDAYLAAKDEFNPIPHVTDCGGFIATVMYATGVDPNYVSVGVGGQIDYVRSNPDKYLIIESPTLNLLRPGDILFTPGHTTMYTGLEKYPSVDASYYNPSTGEGGRVPSVRDAGSASWMINNGAFVARVIE